MTQKQLKIKRALLFTPTLGILIQILLIYKWDCWNYTYGFVLASIIVTAYIYILDKDMINKIKDINQNIYKIINKNHKHDTTK